MIANRPTPTLVCVALIQLTFVHWLRTQKTGSSLYVFFEAQMHTGQVAFHVLLVPQPRHPISHLRKLKYISNLDQLPFPRISFTKQHQLLLGILLGLNIALHQGLSPSLYVQSGPLGMTQTPDRVEIWRPRKA